MKQPESVKNRRGPSRPGGGKPKNRDARKAQRRAAAIERQVAYDALSLDDKVAKAGAKQRAKLL